VGDHLEALAAAVARALARRVRRHRDLPARLQLGQLAPHLPVALGRDQRVLEDMVTVLVIGELLAKRLSFFFGRVDGLDVP
jgi:hypothetical protein